MQMCSIFLFISFRFGKENYKNQRQLKKSQSQLLIKQLPNLFNLCNKLLQVQALVSIEKKNNNEIINNVNNKVNKHLRDIMAFKYDFYFIAASITHQLTMPPANLIQQTLLQYSQVSSLIEQFFFTIVESVFSSINQYAKLW